MTNCSLCNKKIGLFDESGIIDGKKACMDCISKERKKRLDAQITQDSLFKDNHETNQVKNEVIMTAQSRQLLALVGSIFLIIGVFVPIVRLPVVGSMNYIANGTGDGVIVLILAMVSLVCIFQKKYKTLYFTGFASLAMTVFTYVNLGSKLSEARAMLDRQLAGNPFKGLAQAAINTVQLEYGWFFLITGAVLLLISAFATEKDIEKGSN